MKNHLLTLDKTLDDQKDLNKLCQDRPLVTEEIFPGNAYYGNDYILKTYAGLPSDRPLKVILPHGIVLSEEFLWKNEQRALLPIIYNYPPYRFNLLKKETNKIVLPAASPYIYLTLLLSSQPKPERRGTVFFPTHSTNDITAIVNHDETLNELERLDDKYLPVTICVYWRDYNLGYHKIFLDKGYKVFSAGHIFDKYFLFRFYHLCSMHKYAASNANGSHLFYAVKTGNSYFYTKSHLVRSSLASPKILQRDRIKPNTISSNLREMFAKPLDKVSKEQNKLVDAFLGTKHLKTQDGLKKELTFADKLDKFGFARHPENKQRYFRMPNLIPRRFIRKVKRILSKT